MESNSQNSQNSQNLPNSPNSQNLPELQNVGIISSSSFGRPLTSLDLHDFHRANSIANSQKNASDINKYLFDIDNIDLTNDVLCPICLDDTNNSSNSDKKSSFCCLGCKHKFHIICIEKWLKNKLVCPCCRTKPIENVCQNFSLTDTNTNTNSDVEIRRNYQTEPRIVDFIHPELIVQPPRIRPIIIDPFENITMTRRYQQIISLDYDGDEMNIFANPNLNPNLNPNIH